MGGLADIVAVAAPAVGAYLGGPAGAAAGSAISSYLGTQSTNEANAERADQANAWSAAQYASRYQTMVKDLQGAGLNPMLAYTQSPGTAPSAQQVTFQNPASAAVQGYQSASSASQSLAEVEKIKHMNEQIDATVDQIKEVTKKIPLERDQIKYAIQKLAEEAANIAQSTENLVQQRKQIVSLVAKTQAETGLLTNQLAVEQSLDNLGRTSKELAPAASLLLDVYRAGKR